MKLDLGCGGKKREGFLGVDQYPMEGVDVVLKIGTDPWPWADDSVEEIYCSHFLEHLNALQRVHFMNEAFRVMKEGAAAVIITPHWASNRAYGDFTHQWPPVAELFYSYLRRAWRMTSAPHTDVQWNPVGYSCDFETTWGYTFSPDLGSPDSHLVKFALNNYKEAVSDLRATLVKPKKLRI